MLEYPHRIPISIPQFPLFSCCGTKSLHHPQCLCLCTTEDVEFPQEGLICIAAGMIPA